jgi:uncharacterized RDD family membrane protein YckC
MAKSAWFYVDGDGRRGPFFFEEIRQAFQAGELTLDTKLWREGMDDPQPLGQLPEMAQILRPPAPPPEDPNRVLKAGPWSRFLARCIDLSLWYIPIFYLPVSLISLDAEMRLFTRTLFLWVGFVVLKMMLSTLACLMIDALVMAAIGTTPGKWLLRLTLRQEDGRRVPLSWLIARNLRLWVYGLGLGFPIFNLWRLWRSYKQAVAGVSNPWDSPKQLTVEQRAVRSWRFWAAIPLLVVAWLATGTYSKSGVRWENPVTGLSTALPIGWGVRTGTPDRNFWFERPGGRVIVWYEVMPDIDLARYTEGMKRNPSLGTFVREEEKRDPAGEPYIDMTYLNKLDGKDVDIGVRLWRRSSDTYWGIILLKSQSDAQVSKEAEDLAHRIFWTLPAD